MKKSSSDLSLCDDEEGAVACTSKEGENDDKDENSSTSTSSLLPTISSISDMDIESISDLDSECSIEDLGVVEDITAFKKITELLAVDPDPANPDYQRLVNDAYHSICDAKSRMGPGTGPPKLPPRRHSASNQVCNDVRWRLQATLLQRQREKLTKHKLSALCDKALALSRKVTMAKKKEASAPPVAAPDKDDIDSILNFIEGKTCDTGKKKSDKKARQKLKKEEERKKKEHEEALKRAEAERIKEQKRIEEEKRLKEEKAKQQMMLKKNANAKKKQNAKEAESGSKKKGKPNEKTKDEALEQTIPAMLTITRSAQDSTSPPIVTITLKGSTINQQDLLLQFVNSQENVSAVQREKENTSKGANGGNNKKDDKQKQKKKNNTGTQKNVQTNEIQVKLALERNVRKDVAPEKVKESPAPANPKKNGGNVSGANSAKKNNKENKNKQQAKADGGETQANQQKKKTQTPKQSQTQSQVEHVEKENIIDIPSLKLPPGITITKVNGPLTNRKNTEKLIQQQSGTKKRRRRKNKNTAASASAPAPADNSSGENAKAKAKASTSAQQHSQNSQNSQQHERMVTLKNPIFHKLQDKMVTPAADNAAGMININEQATISKGANVQSQQTRTDRAAPIPPQCPAPNTNAPIHQYVPSPVPEHVARSTLSDDRKIIRPPSIRLSSPRNSPGVQFDPSRLGNQNILWGLPGIQITKVNKNGTPGENEQFVEQTADVSIIRTGCSVENANDWPYGYRPGPAFDRWMREIHTESIKDKPWHCPRFS